MTKYNGSYQELKIKIQEAGINGAWEDLGNQKRFNATNGAIINWWESSKTINFQGDSSASTEIKNIFEQNKTVNSNLQNTNTKIFIVHGHDTVALEQLELVLRRLGLDPYILQNSDGQSRTLIEALEQQIYKQSAFGIILMTPDDYGYSKNQTDTERKARARQNVVLEMGMIMASLGRERMVILKKGNLEMPSDVNGVIYLEFNDHVKEIAAKLAQRIKNAGISIEETKISSVMN